MGWNGRIWSSSDPNEAPNMVQGDKIIKQTMKQYGNNIPEGALNFQDYLRQNDPNLTAAHVAKNTDFYTGNYQKYISDYQQKSNNTGYDSIMNQAQKAYDPAQIQKYWDVAQGNLNRSAGNAGAMATRTAGAHSTNMLNPSGFIMNALSKSQEPYAQAQGQLQEGSAKAQQGGAEGLTNLMYLLQRAKQGDQQAANQLQYQYAQLQQQQNQYQQNYEQNQAGFMDYLIPLAGAVLGGPIGASLGSMITGSGSKK